MATYQEAEDLINIGAYKRGSNKKIDRAMDLIDPINNFLKQDTKHSPEFNEILANMKDIINIDD